jgi:glycosyltransferase involved in cell wall biosynthesis
VAAATECCKSTTSSVMKPEILQVIASTDRRGAEVFATDLADELTQRGRAVHTVAVAPGASQNGLPVEAIGTGALSAAWALRRLRRPGANGATAERSTAVPILVAHGSTAVPTCALATLGKPGFVYRNIGDPNYWASSATRRWRLAAYLHSAVRVVVLWPGAADTLVRLHNVSGDRIRPIPNGVPAARFPLADPATRHDARVALGLPLDAPVVSYVGAFSVEKNPAAAIRAAGRSRDLVLVLSGDGPQREELTRLANDVARGRVVFAGVTQQPHAVLAASDALLLPSHTEGMPAVAIEAAFTGIPVVASDVGALREVVLDGESGRVFKAGDDAALDAALAEVLAAGPEMGLRGRDHCLERYEIGVVAGLWDALFDELAPAP